jgi:hypothetical protein
MWKFTFTNFTCICTYDTCYFLQGYKTTAAALSFVCWVLSQHQDIQVRDAEKEMVVLDKRYEQNALIAISLNENVFSGESADGAEGNIWRFGLPTHVP